MAANHKIRCRPIGDADLSGVADLLARGFTRRSRRYWADGLDRLAKRSVPEGLPRFGFLLEADGRTVGAILMIAHTVVHAGAPFTRCNLASWYVEPAFRSHAAMLSMMPLRTKGATYLNISAAPNTWNTIEAQGFGRYSFGQRVVLPTLARGAPGLRVAPFTGAEADLPEAALLADHAAVGCLALVGHGAEGPVPFVLLPLRGWQGRAWLPAMQIVFCRSIGDVERFAAPLGRRLLRRGGALLVYDAPPDHRSALPGVFLKDRARKYVRGDRKPWLGDLAYTEFTIFGP